MELKSYGGGDYVVSAKIANLRQDETRQTKVGLVGGDSLLVAGSMEEVAAKVMAG